MRRIFEGNSRLDIVFTKTANCTVEPVGENVGSVGRQGLLYSSSLANYLGG